MKKLDKKDKRIKELTESVSYWKDEYNDKKDNCNVLQGELRAAKDELNRYKQHIEGRELPAISENQWLKETLRMVIVSADKFDALVKIDPMTMRKTL